MVVCKQLIVWRCYLLQLLNCLALFLSATFHRTSQQHSYTLQCPVDVMNSCYGVSTQPHSRVLNLNQYGAHNLTAAPLLCGFTWCALARGNKPDVGSTLTTMVQYECEKDFRSHKFHFSTSAIGLLSQCLRSTLSACVEFMALVGGLLP